MKKWVKTKKHLDMNRLNYFNIDIFSRLARMKGRKCIEVDLIPDQTF